MATATARRQAKLTDAQLKLEKDNPRLKLQRIGSKRVSRIIKALENVGKLGRYKPTAAQTEAVFGAIMRAFQVAHARWKEQTPEAAKEEFKIPAS